MGEVVKHKSNQLKGQLKMKEKHKKSKVRLIKINMMNSLLVTKEEIDQLKLKIEEKKALVAAKQLRVEEKKSC